MKKAQLSVASRVLATAAFVMLVWPATTFAQRRWVTVRPHRSRVIVYQPRSYVVYQRRPSYSYRTYSAYPQGYYNGYYPGAYSQPYYSRRYYSNQYSQPYFANRYSYSWANPTYRYYGDRYYRRQRRSGLNIRIGLR